MTPKNTQTKGIYCHLEKDGVHFALKANLQQYGVKYIASNHVAFMGNVPSRQRVSWEQAR